MKSASLPSNESVRLQSLHALQLLDSEADAGFDGLTELVADIFNVPMAMITLIDEDRQWFKSKFGLIVCETPRRISFCGHVVADGAPLVIDNALKDPRFSDNPMVTGDPFIRFYAGYPLHTHDRLCIGTICLIDTLPRTFEAADMRRLELFARQAEELIQLHVQRLRRLTSEH